MKISKEFKIGLFGVIGTAILYLGFNYLKGKEVFSRSNHYYVIYENIDGLTVSNSVFVQGFTVGRVSNLIYQQEKGRIVVELDIDGNIILGDSTVAFLRNESFLGGKAIDLHIPVNIKNRKNDGDTLQSALALGILESITQTTLPVADDIGALIRRLNTLIESFQTTELEIRKAVSQFRLTLETVDGTISSNKDGLTEVINHLSNSTANLEVASRKLEPLLTDAGAALDSIQSANLAETLSKTRRAVENLNQLLVSLNEGEGSAGKLLHDDSLYVNLNRSAEDLDKLLIDLREHPKRYVHFSIFGKKDK